MTQLNPVDHRKFITGFDLAGYQAALNTEIIRVMTEKVAELEEEKKKHQAHICEIDSLHQHMGEDAKAIEFNIKVARDWVQDSTMKSSQKKAMTGMFKRIEDLIVRYARAWDSVGHPWPGSE